MAEQHTAPRMQAEYSARGAIGTMGMGRGGLGAALSFYETKCALVDLCPPFNRYNE